MTVMFSRRSLGCDRVIPQLESIKPDDAVAHLTRYFDVCFVNGSNEQVYIFPASTSHQIICHHIIPQCQANNTQASDDWSQDNNQSTLASMMREYYQAHRPALTSIALESRD